MKRHVGWLGGAVLAGVFLSGLAGANPPGPPVSLPAVDTGSPASLAATLRGLLLQALPNPLCEKSKDWGKTVRVRGGWKNHGKWRKICLTSRNLRDTLVLDVRDVQKPAPGRMVFSVFLSFDAQADYDQQNWVRGVRLYAGSVRARLRVRLLLLCESRARMEMLGGFIPDLVFRLRVLQANLSYDNLVVEHFAGFGGTTAQLLGDMIHGILKKLHPSLERRLLEKADAAIVKAGDTREVRLGLGELLKGKK